MVRFLFEIGIKPALAFLNLTGPRIVRAQSTVSSRLYRTLSGEAQKRIVGIYSLPKNRVAEGLRVSRNSQGVDLIGSGKGISLVSFSARYPGPRAEGVNVSVTRTGGRKTLVHTFIPKNSSIRQIFERKRLASGNRVGRLPLVKKWGPAVSQMLKNEKVPPELQELASGYMDEAALDIVRRK